MFRLVFLKSMLFIIVIFILGLRVTLRLVVGDVFHWTLVTQDQTLDKQNVKNEPFNKLVYTKLH